MTTHTNREAVTNWEVKLREIVEKHTIPQVVPHDKKDAKNAYLMTKVMAYELGLEEVVEDWTNDLKELIRQTHLDLLGEVEREVIGEDDVVVEGGIINKSIHMPYNFQVNNKLRSEQRTKLSHIITRVEGK